MTKLNPTAWVDGCTIGQVLRQTAARFGGQDALVFPQADLRCTYAEFDILVDDAARGLLALGLQKEIISASGRAIGPSGSCCNSRWPALAWCWSRSIRATAPPSWSTRFVNPTFGGWRSFRVFVRPITLRCWAKSAPNWRSPRRASSSERFPRLQWVLSVRGGKLPGMLDWAELLDRGRGVSNEDLTERKAQLHCNDPINIQYTSGTTGNPKGAMLSHRNLLLNAYYGGAGLHYTERDRICIPVPLYHCFGCVLGTMCAIVHGSAMVFPHEAFDPGSTLATIEQERCTSLYGVPTMFIAELEHAAFSTRDLSSLRTGIMAGSPCPIELMKRVTTQMGVKEITIGYGQTEASPLITQTRTDDPLERRVGTVGRALPALDVKIIDPESGAELPDGQQGELCARGHCVMLGYYNMPDATAKAIDADGWLHTGDLAVREPNGYYRITGRSKDIIIRGGENIAPREIEEVLYRHPKIEQAQIVGVPSRKYGEELLAWIKLRQGQSATEDEIRDFCRAEMAHFKTPRYIKFVDAFPTTVTGKIQKFKIREQAIEELGLQEVAQIETA